MSELRVMGSHNEPSYAAERPFKVERQRGCVAFAFLLSAAWCTFILWKAIFHDQRPFPAPFCQTCFTEAMKRIAFKGVVTHWERKTYKGKPAPSRIHLVGTLISSSRDTAAWHAVWPILQPESDSSLSFLARNPDFGLGLGPGDSVWKDMGAAWVRREGSERRYRVEAYE